MICKTSELKDKALDWAVAKYEGVPEYFNGETWIITGSVFHISRRPFNPSVKWSQAGPIIEREGISIKPFKDGGEWLANFATVQEDGPTALIAAMRCLVAAKLGSKVDIPDELVLATG
jgi:hypothetical protein